MDQPAFQQTWDYSGLPPHHHNHQQTDGQEDFGLIRGDYASDWNYLGSNQIATDIPRQAEFLFNSERQSGLGHRWSTRYTAFSSLEPSSNADLPLNVTESECALAVGEQNFQQYLVPLSQPESTTELNPLPVPCSDTFHGSSSASEQALAAGKALATQRLKRPQSDPCHKTGRCTKCWALRKPCRTDGDESRCSQCVRLGLPVQICSRERLVEHKPFEKWKNATYEVLFTTVQSIDLAPRAMVGLRHYSNGPTLNVDCHEFLATHQNQTRVLEQNSAGWHSAETTAYCLTNAKVDISSYVQSCVEFALSEACALQHPVAFFFQLARFYQNTLIIRRCLEMYTTLRLMRIKWQFSGDETLGMVAIEDRDSAWYGVKPVPRMIQNQLGHLLELNLIELDRRTLKDVQALMEKRERRSWVVVTLAVFLLLHTRELDAGRNIFWSRYVDSLGFWIHPSKPRALIDEALVSCSSLLSHFHCLIGRKPLDLNWDDQKSKDMVDGDPTVVKSMRKLQAFVLRLKETGLIGRKACNVYRDGDPNSVSFTISSLMFEGTKDGCQVDGFS